MGKGFDSALAGIEERHRGIAAFIGGRDLWRGWLRENKHLDSDTPQRAYWHAGYMAALADVLELLGEGTAPKRMNSICSASNKTTVENEDL